MNALEVKSLVKSYATGERAIDDVSFDIPMGNIVVLLGPSGCGKSTTLRCVAGLEEPTQGSISIDGRVVADPGRMTTVPPRHRDLGMVFQSYAIWPHMTVRQNVEYPLKNKKLSRAQIRKRADEVIELVGLSDYADRSAAMISGGQMQRVALARSLGYSPKLLLLDEPLSNLDATLRLKLRGDLRRIIKEIGVSALYVTHDQSEAVVLGDKVGVMQKGKLQQMATSEEIYNRPSNLFVAAFMGASNLFNVLLMSRDREFGVFQAENGESLRAAVLHDGLAPGDKATIAVRPENLKLAVEGDENIFRGKIVMQQYQGVQTAYEVAALGHRFEVVELGTGPRFSAGDEVSISFPRNSTLAYQM